MNEQNRRRSPRLEQESQVVITIMEPAKVGLKHNMVNQVSQDISIHGVRFRATEFLPLGTILKIQIGLDKQSRPLQIPGIVRRVKQLSNFNMYEIGAEFHSMAPETRQFLNDYITTHSE